MEKNLTLIIDRLVNRLIKAISGECGRDLEGLSLVGSYVAGKISLERPNINIIGFVKPEASSAIWTKSGSVLYRVGREFLDYFRFRVDPFPFRFAQPIGDKELELSVNLNLYDMRDKNLEMWILQNKKIKTPFGAPEVVVQGFKATRKVVFGQDILRQMDFNPSFEDILLGLVKELPLYKLYLTRAPFTYDINRKYEYLATEALEVGKVVLNSTATIFLGEDAVKKGKHVILLEDKERLGEFLDKQGNTNLQKWSKIILQARKNFLRVKKNKELVLELYEASYNVLDFTWGLVVKQVFGQR